MSKKVCKDKISVLPDDLLVKILLLIPTKDAVCTMILSKRWRFVWTMMPILEYNDSKKKSVWWFLDKSLQLHKAPVIEALCIKLRRHCPVDVDVGKWIAKAVDRFVRKLKFKLFWSADPISLPYSLYTSKTLTELRLSRKLFIDFPSYGFLPSLRNLYLLSVIYKDDSSLIRLLSSCPVLEKLIVKRERNDNVNKFSVKVPYLRDLHYTNNDYLFANSPHRCLVIDTPALMDLLFTDYSKDEYLIEKMPCLERVEVMIDNNHNGEDQLLRNISSVLSLEVFLAYNMLVRCSTINFSRLVKLELYSEHSDWLETLMILLQNSPKLKHLVIDYEYIRPPKDLSLSWNQPSSIPRCLSSHLETFTWTGQCGRRVAEKEFVKYILANSTCLKRATISLSSKFNIEEKEKIVEELESIPRLSKASQLLLI